VPGSWLGHSHRPRPRAPTEQAQMRSQSGSVSSCRFGAQAGQIQIAVDKDSHDKRPATEEGVPVHLTILPECYLVGARCLPLSYFISSGIDLDQTERIASEAQAAAIRTSFEQRRELPRSWNYAGCFRVLATSASSRVRPHAPRHQRTAIRHNNTASTMSALSKALASHLAGKCQSSVSGLVKFRPGRPDGWIAPTKASVRLCNSTPNCSRVPIP
jgi:hypothetical protein